MTVLSVDVGAHGALAFLTSGGDLLDAIDMPIVEIKVGKGKRARIATAALADLVRRRNVSQAVVERVSAMPGQGTASMFSFGYAAGAIDGVLAALGIPVTFITPVTWKRGMQVSSDKGSCRFRAMQLFPSRTDLFSRVKDDGRAEAALLGLYAICGAFGGK